MAENEQFSHLCPLLIKISTSSSAQRFRKADLETHEAQGSREEKRHTQKGSHKQKDRQIDEPKENQAEGGGGGVREKLSAGVRQAEIGD